MVSLKSPCATVKKGTGGFQHNGRVSVIISYGTAAKSREKKAFPVADVQQFHGKTTSVLSLGGKDTCWAQGNSEGPHGLQFCRTPDPQTRKHFPFPCSGGLLMCIPYLPVIPCYQTRGAQGMQRRKHTTKANVFQNLEAFCRCQYIKEFVTNNPSNRPAVTQGGV